MTDFPLFDPHTLYGILMQPQLAARDENELVEAMRAVTELADAAYRQNDKAAWEIAERALYVIHTTNHFAPPLHVAPSVIYSTLLSAKLDKALDIDVPQQMSYDEMVSRLGAVITRQNERNHDYAEEMCEGDGMEGVRIYTKNWFCSAHGFVKQLFGIAKGLSIPSRRILIQNVNDETEGDDHVDLRQRWLDAIDVVYHDKPMGNLDDPMYLTATYAMLNYRAAVCNLRRSDFALGSVFVIEGALPSYYERLVKGLRARKFDEHAIEVFWLHVEVDEDHAAEWLETIKVEPTLDEAGYSRVLRGALAGAAMRDDWFDAMKAATRAARA